MKNQEEFALNTLFLEWLMYEIDDVNVIDVGNMHSLILWLKNQ